MGDKICISVLKDDNKVRSLTKSVRGKNCKFLFGL